MSTGLVIAGGTLQIVGTITIFVELAAIRSFEFGVATPWTRAVARVRRLLGMDTHVGGSVTMSGKATMSGRGKARPAPLPPDATDHQRLEWLERYAASLDRDVDGLHERIDIEAEALRLASREGDDRVREEMNRRDAERRRALRPSLQRQAFGATCVLVGGILATIGGVT